MCCPLTISVDVLVAGISLSVAVSVLLVAVGDIGTVVASVSKRVSVWVLLVFVRNQSAVILRDRGHVTTWYIQHTLWAHLVLRASSGSPPRSWYHLRLRPRRTDLRSRRCRRPPDQSWAWTHSCPLGQAQKQNVMSRVTGVRHSSRLWVSPFYSVCCCPCREESGRDTRQCPCPRRTCSRYLPIPHYTADTHTHTGQELMKPWLWDQTDWASELGSNLTLHETSPFLSMVQWALVSQGLKFNAAQEFLGKQPDVWLPRKPGLQPPHLYEPWEVKRFDPLSTRGQRLTTDQTVSEKKKKTHHSVDADRVRDAGVREVDTLINVYTLLRTHTDTLHHLHVPHQFVCVFVCFSPVCVSWRSPVQYQPVAPPTVQEDKADIWTPRLCWRRPQERNMASARTEGRGYNNNDNNITVIRFLQIHHKGKLTN